MNYTTGICFISINGIQTQLRFGMPANKMIAEAILDKQNVIENETLTEYGIATVIHAGYVNACMVNETKIEYHTGFFLAWVDECIIDGQNQLEEVLKCYNESKFTKAYLNAANEAAEEIKKKTITSTSNRSAMKNSDLQKKSSIAAQSQNFGQGQRVGNGNKTGKLKKR